MHFRDFRQAGNGRVLFSAFLYFDMSFMAWVLLGVLATFIADDLGLSAAEKGLVAGVPLLAGSAFRLILGPLSDHIGSRKTGLIGLSLTFIPLSVAWLFADSLGMVLFTGVLLGVAGASFAVALPLASRWYPPEHQGLALGIAAAGNSGTVVAALLGPRIAEQVGWHAVFGLALLPIAVTWVVFFLLAKDSPTAPPPPKLRAYMGNLRRPETLWFCLFYSITFGGFVGLSSYLGIFYRDQYGLSRVEAGDLTALCVFAGSLLRPVGGFVSDRVGGLRVLLAVLVVVVGLCVAISSLPQLWLAAALIFVTMAALGVGNGALFQVIPGVFPREIGVVTGLVGAAGGIGGFYLPMLLGSLKTSSGSFGPGFLAFAALAAVGLVLLLVLRSRIALPRTSVAGPEAA